MRIEKDPYSPCFCGSGKKYRFCCQKKYQRSGNLRTGSSTGLLIGDFELGESLNSRGLLNIQEGNYKQAILCFEQSIAANNLVFTANNNLALAHYLAGNIEKAIEIQDQCIKDFSIPNPFGHANLSLFYQFLGEEAKADAAATVASKLEALNPDATAKVCETLARLRRHEDIIKNADASNFWRDPQVCFYTGVAAANLGDKERAIKDLRRASSKHPKEELAREYLQHLINDTKPDCVRGDWAYMIPQEFHVSPTLFKDESTESIVLSSRYLVDFMEALLNDCPELADDAVEIASMSKHPEAINLLKLLLQRNFGTVRLRIITMKFLKELGVLQEDEEALFSNYEDMKDFKEFQIKLNPEFVFYETPEVILKREKELLTEARSIFANLNHIIREFEKLLPLAPDCYPLHYNYAVHLHRAGRLADAEKIFRRIVEEHPEYLFASGTLLSILIASDRLQEAGELVKNITLPEETHPSAFAAWLCGQTEYFESCGEYTAAFSAIKSAYKIDPESQAVKMLWNNWRDYDIKKNTSPYLRRKQNAKNDCSFARYFI